MCGGRTEFSSALRLSLTVIPISDLKQDKNTTTSPQILADQSLEEIELYQSGLLINNNDIK